MTLMSLAEYEKLKGKVSTKASAFEKGQIAAFAYIADCAGCSLTFGGMEDVVRKIESGRKLKQKEK